MGVRLFLLSPASCAGNRARLLLAGSARFPLAEQVRAEPGAPLGEVFAFISQLYFRGKLAYARAFARVPPSWPACADVAAGSRRGATGGAGSLAPHGTGVFVITTSRGLLDWRARITVETMREFAAVEMRLANAAYTGPLEESAAGVASRLTPADEVVLLGSIASDKYVAILREALGSRLRFPREFVGRGDMSRGGLLLRCVQEGRELEYVPLAGSARHGSRPPRLGPPPRRIA